MQPVDPRSPYKLSESKTDDYIYNSEIFATINPTIFSSITPYSLPIQTPAFLYHINARHLYSPLNQLNPTILYLHGHGSCCTWATWLKLAFLLFEAGFNGILIDLPGYGKSTIEGESRINPKLYMNDAHNLFTKLCKTFLFDEKNKKIIGVGFCGGAANLIRTISEEPGFFAKKHIFHNSVIGQIPEKFEKNLEKFNMKVWVSWCEDVDHSKGCVAYKYFNKKRKEGNKHVFLRDIGEEELSSNGMWSKNMGRKTSNIMIFEPSAGYVEFVKEFLKDSCDKIPVFKSLAKNDEDVIEKIKEMSLKEIRLKESEIIDDDLEKALKMSLEQK